MRFDAVIFDIDNVLVDTRASYTDCIRHTVQLYYEKFLKLKPSRTPLLSREDVEWFKSLGGFNDDWDTCYGLLLYLTSAGKKHRPAAKPLGVKGAEQIFGKHKLISLRKIESIFQPLYLKRYHKKEKLLLPQPFLLRLKRSGLKFGIVTGRNRKEARMALDRFKIRSLFDIIITTDETPRGKKKPHPYGLIAIAKKIGKDLRYLYVGDLADDILAGERAKRSIKIKSCAYLATSHEPKAAARALKRLGADYVAQAPSNLTRILLTPH